MELKLIRKWKKPTYTVGQLYVDGKFFSNTIEDTDRGLKRSMTLDEIYKLKKAGITCIPSGKYVVSLDYQSPKYAKKAAMVKFNNAMMPRLIDVPGYSGVLIHPGNSAKDTEGCILPGKNDKVGWVSNSTAYFKDLYNRMWNAKNTRGEKITIEII